MRIGVCIKEVPDTVTKIALKPDQSGILTEGIQYIMNPYDEYALEEALKIKDKDPATEVVVFSVGVARVAETIRKALAMGADRAVHLQLDHDTFLDGLAVAKMLTKMIEPEKCDALFVGKQAIDDDAFQVGPMLAALGGLTQVTNVSAIEAVGQTEGFPWRVVREVEGGAKEIVGIRLPALLGWSKGSTEPRYPSLKGIMAAKKKEIKVVALSAFGLEIKQLVGLKVEQFELPAERQNCKMIEGDVTDAAEKLARMLREEAKVI